ncbi:amine oxidase [Mycobacterium sp. ENV421]|uniref:NAD(P)/FAD-dependent oxidoreductase n=1 Tax=Mycobacterium sp. ENV421 TaxID=1213407 RepID=UPI000C99CE9D|nr:NAD(P)/FAD-dependent oxidoreductase [Mycobacterium sp. ENV421]PND58750.1 amine oxidase [Mycobacterium sp. ENV421]
MSEQPQVDDCDVLVIGAGLAGLRCAVVLAERGYEVAVWEAEDQVGGRIRTDIVDGFRCDRGFQVLNPAYPALHGAVAVRDLKLQPFEAGVVVRRDHDRVKWVHPLRQPRDVPQMLMRGGLSPRQVAALLRWAAPALRPGVLAAAHHDTDLHDALDHCRVEGISRRVLDRFLAGVLLDDTGSTSNAFALLLTRMFALGVPGLPADGMRALPELLAAPIMDRIHLQHKVTRISRAGADWAVTGGEVTVRAREVVVAADAPASSVLTGAPPPAMKGVVTDWWAGDDLPPRPAMLSVDGRAEPPGPVVNTAVISSAAPTYAPPGRHLIAASALIGPQRRPPSEAVLRRHAADILGLDASTWTLVVRHEIPDALPAQPAPLVVRRPVRSPDGLWLCGDHRDTASIQGALVSGRRVAEAIMARRIGATA